MNYKNYNGAIFDCDGTLLDSMGMWLKNATRVVKHLDLEPTKDLDEICIKKSMKDACIYIKETYKLNMNADELNRLAYKLVEDEYLYNLKLKAHTKDLLDELKSLNYKMIVATATPSDLVKRCLKRLGVLEYFVDVISVKDYNTTKKEPKIFEIALEKIGTKKEETLVFEDDANPIITCLNASFNVVGVKDIAQGIEFEEIKPKLKALINLD